MNKAGSIDGEGPNGSIIDEKSTYASSLFSLLGVLMLSAQLLTAQEHQQVTSPQADVVEFQFIIASDEAPNITRGDLPLGREMCRGSGLDGCSSVSFPGSLLQTLGVVDPG